MTDQLATPETAARRLDFESHSIADTIRIGHEIAAVLTPPKVLILRGTLGAGKTTLVKGIAEALHAAEADEVTSPTFTLVHEYDGSRLVDGQEQPVSLYHLDLYRLETERQVEGIGIGELAADDAVVLIEWGEKFPSVLRRAHGEICMETAGGDSRKITLTLKG
ncbi:MAG TPA: tRNA (adenosine(37)-N6)-threonylcarbamoyltransferase complex ATPase subunit type 1 TsaE [Acidobacteriaceae bacterium]